jgi:serine/threonine protein kinase
VIELDGYRDLEQIGLGGSGVVFRAIRAATGSPVAIKVLRDVADQSAASHYLQREQAALVTLTGHPNVIELFEVLALDDGQALVMEYAPGGSVADLMTRRGGTLTAGEAAQIGRQAADALSAAHALGIVHRDVKPHNLLIDASRQIKLCDFGIASLIHTVEFRGRISAWSERYASPEDLDDDIEVGPPSDIYSLGATLLHLVHGAPPSSRERIAGWQARPSDDPGCKVFDEILAACLQPHPDARPTADALATRLDRLSRTLGDHRPEPARVVEGPAAPPQLDRSLRPDPDETLHRARCRPPREPNSSPKPRRRRTLRLGGLAVFAVIGLVAIVLLIRAPGEPRRVALPTPDAVTRSVAPPKSATKVLVNAMTEIPAVTTGRPPELVASDTPLTDTGRPDGLVDIDASIIRWPFGVVGGCLVQRLELTDLQPVPCDEPHDLQRFAVGVLDPVEFPAGMGYDQAAIQAAVEAVCESELESFKLESLMGAGRDGGAFDLPVTRPSAASWARGDRRFQCLLGVSQRRIVGDAIGRTPGPGDP